MRAIPTLTVNEQTYELNLDGNAHEAIEEATGRSILDNTWQPQTIQELGLFLWACTRTSAPHLTVEQVMANLGMAHVPFVLEAIAEIMLSQTGDTESDKRSLAPFVATPPQVAEAMAQFVQAGDHVLDIGCGTGSLLVAARNRGAAKLMGYESDKERAQKCRQTLWTGAAPNLVVDVRCENVLDTDGNILPLDLVEGADVILLYLLNTSNMRLKDAMVAKMKEGVTLVSHDFPMYGWTETTVIDIQPPNDRHHKVYVYHPKGQRPV